jgi:hypothetical protein
MHDEHVRPSAIRLIGSKPLLHIRRSRVETRWSPVPAPVRACVSVLRRLGNGFAADVAVRAAAVLDHERFAVTRSAFARGGGPRCRPPPTGNGTISAPVRRDNSARSLLLAASSAFTQLRWLHSIQSFVSPRFHSPSRPSRGGRSILSSLINTGRTHSAAIARCHAEASARRKLDRLRVCKRQSRARPAWVCLRAPLHGLPQGHVSRCWPASWCRSRTIGFQLTAPITTRAASAAHRRERGGVDG